jgi:hypothetical protein
VPKPIGDLLCVEIVVANPKKQVNQHRNRFPDRVQAADSIDTPEHDHEDYPAGPEDEYARILIENVN